ncbi:PREDICTED: zinc finger CCCH domain-containing protein 13-like [Camelina sativa]|uniref:Zinc finger CCCH domain-containing protein 13-like n=1 Tax=Camelina sativa TaxID=90675 RepID=A0ABM1QXI5_CAMSA|nr:PREDICTED: zinc finger CCCH domain-containing protein 13-like [Camelina sativa]
MSDKKLPEHPGKRECGTYLITGNCNLKNKCKYHHPKNITPIEPGLALNDNGLPLRPNQAVCPDFSRFGLCKSGPTCKFDHSTEPSSSSSSGGK